LKEEYIIYKFNEIAAKKRAKKTSLNQIREIDSNAVYLFMYNL